MLEHVPPEISRGIKRLLQESIKEILQEAEAHLRFPIMVTAACPAGSLMAMTIAYPGATAILQPMVNEVEMGTFPVTVTCTGNDGSTVRGTIPEPELETKGTLKGS
jgi:hypothetical protein